METVLVDSGAILALLNRDSLYHRPARVMLTEMKNGGALPLLTNYTVAEAFSLLSAIIGPDAGRTWLRHNIWPVERVSNADEKRAVEILLGEGGNGLSYTDGANIAVMERLGLDRIFSFNQLYEDRGFNLVHIGE